VGGTKIRSGLVDREGNVLAVREVGSPGTSEEEVVGTIDSAVEELLSERVVAIGYGIPANIERGSSRVLWATNLPLVDVDLRSRSLERFGLPVGIENDASAAALAEWKLGAGRGREDLLMLTLGTGVGGGVVVDGRLFRGWAEIGHFVVQEGGRQCTCGGHGHLEVLASGSAADVAARELYGNGADAQMLVERAWSGDDRAREALARIGRTLGAAIGSLVNVFASDLVVIGGGFGAAAGRLVLDPARESARREAIYPANERLELVLAKLGEEAGLIGAGLVGFEALDGSR